MPWPCRGSPACASAPAARRWPRAASRYAWPPRWTSRWRRSRRPRRARRCDSRAPPPRGRRRRDRRAVLSSIRRARCRGAWSRSITRGCGTLWAMLEGKTGIVLGVANKRSIAWAIAQALAGAGMRLAFSYQGERLKENVEELAATLPGSQLYACDVGVDAEITEVFAAVERDLGRLDTLVHSVAYARKEDLEGGFLGTDREGFRIAHDVSAYSLVAVTRAAAPLMEKGGGGSVLAMTY